LHRVDAELLEPARRVPQQRRNRFASRNVGEVRGPVADEQAFGDGLVGG
jgi:hypothetical protein